MVEANQKRNYIIIGIVVVALVAGGFWYWKKRAAEPKEAGIGAKIFEDAQNPLKGELPETNPFAAETNPFDSTNPFKAEYKNPFK